MPTKVTKLIPYWCTSCGRKQHYVDCDVIEVYMRCGTCSPIPKLFVRDKLMAIKILNQTRITATLDILKLTGIEMEDVAGRSSSPIFSKWIRAEEKKRRQ